MAINDWVLKREAMMEKVLQDTQTGLFTYALTDPNNSKHLDNVVKAQRKWHKSTPHAYLEEVGNLCRRFFKSNTPDTTAFFIASDIDAFKARIEANRNPAGARREPAWHAEPVHVLTALDQDRIHSFRDSVRARKLDQRLYYLNADSAEVWHELINAGDYRQYDWCRDALKTLARSLAWGKELADGTLETIVMLGGGGSASKDVEMLSALVDARYREGSPRKTNYVLLDISPHMVSATMSRIKKYFRREPLADALIHVRGIVADMLEIRQIRSLLRVGGSRTAWFLTGGTIGNMSERAVLSAIEEVAEDGDLLAIGIDTYDAAYPADARRAILAKYRPEMMQDFLHTPIGVLVRHLDRDLSSATLRELIKPDVVDGRQKGYSDLDDALTAEVRLDLGKDGTFTLLTSTRYDEDGFVRWVEMRGWKKIELFSASDPSSYFRQAFFRRLKAA